MEDEARDLNSILSYLLTNHANTKNTFSWQQGPTGLDRNSAAHWDGDKAENLFPIAFYQRQDKKQKAKPWCQVCSPMRCILPQSLVSNAGPHLGCLCAATLSSPPCPFHEQATLWARTGARCSRSWTPTWMPQPPTPLLQTGGSMNKDQVF